MILFHHQAVETRLDAVCSRSEIPSLNSQLKTINFRSGCRGWTRTTIVAFKGRCPTVRRPGNEIKNEECRVHAVHCASCILFALLIEMVAGGQIAVGFWHRLRGAKMFVGAFPGVSRARHPWLPSVNPFGFGAGAFVRAARGYFL